ncbi:hypothetical protein JCM16138_01200 [Thermococcus atlanticus]
MADRESYLLPALFLIQAGVNLAFYGFPAVMFSVIIPNSLHWALPPLVIGYFALGIFALYNLSTPDFRKGRPLGVAYFGIGAVGSGAVIMESLNESPFFMGLFALWFISSLVGMFLLFRGAGVSPRLAFVVMALLGISALVSALTAQWVVQDYHAHVHTGEIPDNATVIIAPPENVSPSNTTG